MVTFYGSDSSCISDVGLVDVQITDPIVLIGQRLARRLQTPRGGLAAFGGPADFGFDVRQLLLSRLTDAARATARQAIVNECLQDEQVLSVDVELELVPSTGALSLRIDGVSSAGPFTLTGDIQQFSAPDFIIS